MKIVNALKRGLNYLKNQNIELRIRMLFFLEYAAFFACIIGTIAMIYFVTSPIVLVPNFILVFICMIGIYLSQYKKKYNLAAVFIVGGCAYIALPFMFFTAGGNKSGMPIWFLFGVIFTCMMLDGILRIIMSGLSILISVTCMLIGYHNPNLVLPLENEQSEFMDMLQSFALVSIIVCICLLIFIYAYDKQKQILLIQQKELKKFMYTDALTGIANRHAYYDDTRQYSEGLFQENLILVAMDVNGLKSVNDSKGHAAGDELIKSAAGIMMDAFSKYGKVYRTGGDEFMAILFCEDCDAEKYADLLSTVTNYVNGKMDSDISIAVGVVTWKLNQDKNFFELEKMADVLMYQNKSKFYRESGIDRRKR